MALIKCPECGKEISDKAKSCIHCGISIEDIKEIQREQADALIELDDTYVFICPKCGNINGGKTQIQKHCIMCDEVYLQTDMKRTEYQAIISENFLKPTSNKIDEIQEQLRNEYVADTLDKKEVSNTRQKQKDLADAIIKAYAPSNPNVPKCPTCQSADIKKISVTSKAGSVALWGLFSQKVKKQWHCNNCGSEW